MILRLRQTGQMDVATRSRRIDAEGRRLLETGAKDLVAAVPTCPGWTVRDLVAHVADTWNSLHTLMMKSSADQSADFADFVSAPSGQDGLLSFADDSLTAVVRAVAEVDPTESVWTWTAERTKEFYTRRAHHETLVHRIDAEIALSDRTPVDAADAIDSIDELFSVLAPSMGRSMPTGSLHLHQTDGDGEFMLSVVDGSLAVTREHAKGDAALRGTAEELWLAMWQRASIEGMELFGDETVVAQWTGLVS
jgi:uncharacterized protein (TIGR03083 family)